jgi:hypothetical protein
VPVIGIRHEVPVALHDGMSHWTTVGSRGPERAAIIVSIKDEVSVPLQDELHSTASGEQRVADVQLLIGIETVHETSSAAQRLKAR